MSYNRDRAGINAEQGRATSRLSRRGFLSAAGAAGAGLLAAAQTPAAASPAHGGRSSAKRVLVLVVDGLNRDAIRRHRMRRVAGMLAGGVHFRNSYLGHMGAETVVSHNVITSGQLPKHMGWADEGFRDTTGVLRPLSDEPETPYWITSGFTAEQMFALVGQAGYPKLADYLHAVFPGRTVATVSPKGYAGYAFGGPSADMIVTFGDPDADCDGDGIKNWRRPAGINVPRYLSEQCGRFTVDSAEDLTYDTLNSPARMYPVHGNRYVPGHDPEHLGGDVWAADAALAIMRNEDWSGLFVTLPGLDKASHMWGSRDDHPPYGDPMTHVARAAQVADEQVGRILDELSESGTLEDTLVVLTADHGFLPARRHHGIDDGTDSRGYLNWYYGDTANGDYLQPAPPLQPLVDTGNVGMSYQDSAIRVWLQDQSPAKMREAAGALNGMPDVIATFERGGDRYRQTYGASRKAMSVAEWTWYRRHGHELVDTQAAPYGPDVVGLLRDNVSYGIAGDHGGAQRAVQDIPIGFYGAGVGPAQPGAPMRSVDIMPTILRAMGIDASYRHDGIAYSVPAYRGR